MGAHQKPTADHQIPCSMKHVGPLDHLGDDLCSLSEPHRFEEFQFWANHIRGNSSGACTNEYLMCPMLWCRAKFEDQASTVEHLSRCDQREDAWYWCPQCSHPECFMGRRQVAAKVRTHVKGKKSLIRRRAVKFLKNLSCTSRTKDVEVRRTRDSEIATQGRSDNNGYSKHREFEFAKSSVMQAAPFAPLAELAISKEKIYEMARHTQYFAELPTGSNSIVNIELPGSSFAIAELYTSESATLADHEYSELSVSPDRFSNISTTSQGSIMKNSYLQQSDSSHLPAMPPSSPEGMPALESDLRSLTPLVTSFDFKENGLNLNSISKDVSISEMSSFLDLEEDLTDQGDHLSTLEHVEWLREFFTVVENDWQRKLSSMSDLLSIYSRLSGRTMFELGITSLKQFYEGMPAYTFDQIFALMHVACAYTYMLHGYDKSYCWDRLYRDMLPWQYLIFEKTSRLMFIRVVDRLMGSPSLSTSLEPEVPASAMSDYDGLMLLLKEGRILQNCSIFLAGFHYATVRERDEQVPVNREMSEHIVQPLLQHDGIEALRDCVLDAQTRIENGLLCRIWEAEAMLISTGSIRCQKYDMFQRYHSAVTSLCDNAMQLADPTWRYPLYTHTFDTILATSWETDKRQKYGPHANHWPNADVLEEIYSSRTISESPTPTDSNGTEGITSSVLSATSASGTDSLGSTLHSASSGTSNPFSVQSSSLESGGSTLTSPTTIGTNSSLASSSPVSPKSSRVLRCDLCDKPFTGEFCASNLLRHKRYAKIHNKDTKFECPEPDCGVPIGRSDNMKKHLQTFHPLSEYLSTRKEKTGRLRKGLMKRIRR